jgi:CTP synthase
VAHDLGVDVEWVSSEKVEEHGVDWIDRFDAVLVPGGFGMRGIPGMLDTVRHIREAGIPYLGICLGLQCAIIEYARNVCGLEAHSAEFDRGVSDPVISLLDSQHKVTDMGGTMRLGAYPCRLQPGSLTHDVYEQDEISERHRHRYEVNPEYGDTLNRAGMRFSGVSPDGQLVEIIELPDHPFFIATQFHPELKSRPSRPHPLFAAFVGAANRRHIGRAGHDDKSETTETVTVSG